MRSKTAFLTAVLEKVANCAFICFSLPFGKNTTVCVYVIIEQSGADGSRVGGCAKKFFDGKKRPSHSRGVCRVLVFVKKCSHNTGET